MANQYASAQQNDAQAWGLRLSQPRLEAFSSHNHRLVAVDGLLADPEHAISDACLQKFAKISPQYPGERAALDPAVSARWLAQLSPLLDQWFGPYGRRWEMQAWYSIVSTPPGALQADPAPAAR
ncbi:MAG: hypothetical protein HC870_00030 [Rhizobiales bacterium]|nr:hypothetical protein [Hyphomicrobiales bacterium]